MTKSKGLVALSRRFDLKLFVKYIPVLATAINAGICIEYFTFRTEVVYDLAGIFNGYGITVIMMLWAGNIRYKLCTWHKMMVLSMLANLLIEEYMHYEVLKVLAYSNSIITIIILATWITTKTGAKNRPI